MASSLTMLPPAVVAVRDTLPAPPMCGLPVPGGHCTRHLHHDGECCLSGEPTAPVLPDDLDETPFRCEYCGEADCENEKHRPPTLADFKMTHAKCGTCRAWVPLMAGECVDCFEDRTDFQVRPATGKRECPDCGGEGRLLVRARGRHDVDDVTCGLCGGYGKVPR